VALRLENEFVVQAPIEPTWQTLLDLERVAACLPGATIEAGAEQGTYDGSMRVKLGPVSLSYRGTARLELVDEATHTAVFAVQGKEARGQGSASATIRNSLVPVDGATRVLVETELSVTGRPAQFGRGIMQDVAGSMLTDFAGCLSKLLAADHTASSPLAAASEAEHLEVGGVVGRAVLGRVRAFFLRLLRRS
jgi:carbon monoxide dehydrogenase subunit G